MDVITVPESEDSENSVVEVEVPKKPTPPLIEIEEEEIILNVKSSNRHNILARDLIRDDLQLVEESPNTHSTMSNVSSPSHWTVDMIKFYNDDWGGEEEFIVEKIQAKMNKSPSLWQISRKDYLYMKNKRQRYDIKCSNCLHYGHHISLCPEPPYVRKCHMCGNKGHSNQFCPNSICLNCGNPSRKYSTSCYKCRNQINQMCSRCHLVGHNFTDCSDHWRLFHLTTNSLSVVVPKKEAYKLEKDMWCCNCGYKGHHQSKCLHEKNLQYPDTLPFVSSYKRAFQFNEYLDQATGKHKKKFKERGHEEQMDRVRKINDLNRAMKNNKFHLSHYNFKKFRKFKKHDKRKWRN